VNIFAVDKDPQTAAQQLCDKHVVKMILESAQMLCSAFPSGDAPTGELSTTIPVASG